MSEIPEIEIAVRLIGDGVCPDDISAKVGLLPTKTWRKGELISSTKLVRKEDVWSVALKEHTFDFEKLLIQLLDRIEPAKDRMLDVVNRMKLKVEVSSAVYIKGQSPSLYLSVQTIARLQSLHANLDIDLILLPSL